MKRNLRILLFTLAILLVIGLIFSGCKKEATEIVIGGVGPVSGEAATFGQSTKEGCELAVEEWNAAGGLLGKNIKLIYQDDKGDPTEAATVWTKLITQDKVVAIVGTVMSKCSLAGAPISQQYKVPMISPTSTNPKVTEVGDYIFRACFIDPFQGTVGAKFAYENLKARKAACIFDVGNDYTKGLAEFFRDKFTELGGTIVAFEAHPTGTTDFKAQLTKIIAAKPDVIYISDYYNDVGLIAKQARELGFNGPLVGGDGWDSPDLVKIGGTAVENGYFTNHFSKDDPRPIVQEFVKKYQAKFGKVPDALAALAYDAMQIMLDAIKRAGSTDPEKIKKALAETNINVVSGLITFDKNRNPIKSAVIIAIKNGQQVYQATVNP
ncbi:MAG: ABC transporter substrate-binding protein [Spirochaetales bacterium]|jgi:branched-chain amino acid transport system substrate-binding protein|nr:ABC transporter substrate-binding protein [Exilispira sp.]NMC67573.1 ABC transporter substrate-binding protein [Spirochaetales bacterium]